MTDEPLVRCAHAEMRPTDSLKPNPRNPNRHGVEQIELFAKIVRHTGWRRPIVVSKRSGFVVKGHGQLMVAQAIGATVVPVDFHDYATEEEEWQDLLADNRIAELSEREDSVVAQLLKELSQRGAQIDLTGYTTSDIDRMLDQLSKTSTPPQSLAKAKELAKKWGTKSGQIWALGNHRIACGSCVDPNMIGRLFGDQHPTMLFTSPPYGVGIDYGETYQDTFEELHQMIPQLAKQWFGLVKPGGYAVVNFGDIISAKDICKTKEPCEYPMALEYYPAFRATGWLLWSRRIWCKPAAGTGSLQCVGSNRASTNWEHVWTWKKPGRALVGAQTTGTFPSQNGWFDTVHDHKLNVGLKDHGAGMPVSVAERMIIIHSRHRDLVFEPFLGTGTTLVACEQNDRRCFATDINPAFVAIALERWSDLTTKKPKLMDAHG